MSQEKTLAGRLASVQERIRLAAVAAGREPASVELLAVSKTVDADTIGATWELGQIAFGENRVQELLEKADKLNKGIHWHLTGQLQTNKVRMLVGRDVLIHSLDRLSLVEEMERVSRNTGHVFRTLLEVNVAGEESKGGISLQEARPLLERIADGGLICVEGLMTVAPYSRNPEEIRPVFRSLRDLAVDIAALGMDNITMRHLSMGMSGDFEAAILEGATIVRVGTAIFGERHYGGKTP